LAAGACVEDDSGPEGGSDMLVPSFSQIVIRVLRLLVPAAAGSLTTSENVGLVVRLRAPFPQVPPKIRETSGNGVRRSDKGGNDCLGRHLYLAGMEHRGGFQDFCLTVKVQRLDAIHSCRMYMYTFIVGDDFRSSRELYQMSFILGHLLRE
jgi:hypothetical protein